MIVHNTEWEERGPQMQPNPTLEGIDLVPGITDGYGKTMLYVGASVVRHFLVEELIAWGWTLDLLEIWPPNWEHFENMNPPLFRKAFLGDVRNPALYGPEGLHGYNAAVWWHGPEHIPQEHLSDAIRLLSEAAELVVVGAPGMEAPYEYCLPDYPNTNESHLWSVSCADLGVVGLSCTEIPRANDTIGLVAWKKSH
jgi:hypothetical protein